MRARLLDSSCGRSVGTLIHSRLHLLQEVVDARQVTLGPQIWQWQCVLVLGDMVATATAVSRAIDRHQRRTGGDVVCGDGPALDWDALQSHESLAHLLVGGGIDAVTLEITEEIVQGIEIALSGVEGSMLVHVTSMADRVVNGAVGCWLLWGVIAVVGDRKSVV